MRIWTLLLLLLWPLRAAWAQGDIHRCMGANGIPVFTDRVCSDVNATPVMPAPTSSAAQVAADLAQPPAVLCAADLAQLKQAIIDAFAVRKPNRLAGLVLWDGDAKAGVVTDIRLFSRLMAQPLIDVKAVSSSAPASSSSASGDDDADSSELSPSAASTSTAGGEAVLVQTESDDGSGATQTTRFDVVHHAGCLWLHPQW
ncbi:DUF4124 domain-containing protein [Dyella jejuensis]|uniref:DUF4124 domain-containing protein n=1 Tax=Dyella jejuensis TaxID=1432009 RepID=A0ABW8JIH0_9GAMM